MPNSVKIYSLLFSFAMTSSLYGADFDRLGSYEGVSKQIAEGYQIQPDCAERKNEVWLTPVSMKADNQVNILTWLSSKFDCIADYDWFVPTSTSKIGAFIFARRQLLNTINLTGSQSVSSFEMSYDLDVGTIQEHVIWRNEIKVDVAADNSMTIFHKEVRLTDGASVTTTGIYKLKKKWTDGPIVLD